MKAVRAFEVGIRGEPRTTTINSVSRGKAKSEFFRDVSDCYPDLKFTEIVCHSLGNDPIEPDGFREIARLRGVPFAKVGMAVQIGGGFASDYGNIVGFNASRNFNVHLVSGSRKGQVVNCHPTSKIRYFNHKMETVAEFAQA